MKNRFIIFTLLIISILSCSSPLIEKVEESFPDGKPKVVGVYQLVDNTEEKVKEKEFYSDGKLLMQGGYKNGKRDGEWKAFHKNGAVWSEGTFVNGERNGYGKNYYENGKLREEGTYKDGKQVGLWKYYNELGILIDERTK